MSRQITLPLLLLAGVLVVQVFSDIVLTDYEGVSLNAYLTTISKTDRDRIESSLQDWDERKQKVVLSPEYKQLRKTLYDKKVVSWTRSPDGIEFMRREMLKLNSQENVLWEFFYGRVSDDKQNGKEMLNKIYTSLYEIKNGRWVNRSDYVEVLRNLYESTVRPWMRNPDGQNALSLTPHEEDVYEIFYGKLDAGDKKAVYESLYEEKNNRGEMVRRSDFLETLRVIYNTKVKKWMSQPDGIKALAKIVSSSVQRPSIKVSSEVYTLKDMVNLYREYAPGAEKAYGAACYAYNGKKKAFEKDSEYDKKLTLFYESTVYKWLETDYGHEALEIYYERAVKSGKIAKYETVAKCVKAAKSEKVVKFEKAAIPTKRR